LRSLTGRRTRLEEEPLPVRKKTMRFALRIAELAALMLLMARGTAAAAPHWNPSPTFIKNDCNDGIRDYGSRLEGWPNNTGWPAWLTTCQSTPADFLDGTDPTPHHFNSPTRCEFSKNTFGNVDGVWGHFSVPETCPRQYRVGCGCAIDQIRGQSTASVPGTVAAMLGLGVIISIRRRRRRAMGPTVVGPAATCARFGSPLGDPSAPTDTKM
jgi:hypothetical protein